MKRVLSVQDLSCLGKCSLTVALPILSAMGLACTALPTAVLSSHTGFANPCRYPMTDQMGEISAHWQSVGAEFDAVSIGYLANSAQAAAVEAVLARFPALTVLDPAMGDDGRLYAGLSEAQVEATKQLCPRADVLLPNLTEAALLTGLPYREHGEESYLRELCAGLLETGAKGVVITGLSWDGTHTGFAGFGTDFFTYRAKRIPRKLHGTGDMFTAVTTGALVRGMPLYEAAALAAGFVERVVDATPAATPFGAEFETQLPWLWERL